MAHMLVEKKAKATCMYLVYSALHHGPIQAARFQQQTVGATTVELAAPLMMHNSAANTLATSHDTQ